MNKRQRKKQFKKKYGGGYRVYSVLTEDGIRRTFADALTITGSSMEFNSHMSELYLKVINNSVVYKHLP